MGSANSTGSKSATSLGLNSVTNGAGLLIAVPPALDTNPVADLQTTTGSLVLKGDLASSTIRTATFGGRVEIPASIASGFVVPVVKLYSGNSGEYAPAQVKISGNVLEIDGPSWDPTQIQPTFLQIRGGVFGGTPSQIKMQASLLTGGPTNNGGLPLLLQSGTIDPTTTQCYVQAGSSVLTTDVNSQINLTFPVAFPTGTDAFVVMNGDFNVSASWIITAQANPGPSGVLMTVVASSAGAGVGSGHTLRINWIAIGH